MPELSLADQLRQSIGQMVDSPVHMDIGARSTSCGQPIAPLLGAGPLVTALWNHVTCPACRMESHPSLEVVEEFLGA